MRASLILLSFLVAASAGAQTSRRPLRDGAYTFERQTRERWLHGRQRPEFTGFAHDADWVVLDSVRPRAGGGGARVLYLSTPDQGWYRIRGTLANDARGRLLRVTGRLPKQSRDDDIDPDRDTAQSRRWDLFAAEASEERLQLPEARFWELAPSFDAPRPAAGVSWSDTLALEARHGEYRQSLRGVRTSTIVGDTTLAGGLRLWIVRDSALVHYEERALTKERTLDTLVVVERTGDGTIVGRHLYDPALALYRVRHDTTALAGEAVLRYPDGRSWRTPARLERTRRIALHDRASYDARRQALFEAGGEPSMVLRPEGVAERLAKGDSALGDSLLGAWDRSRDPEERAASRELLESWGGRVPDLARRMRALALVAGDTASVAAAVGDAWYGGDRGPVDSADLAFVLPFMADPGLAFAFDIRRDVLYENARQGLLTYPPALVPRDPRRACTPAACRALAAQWPGATEPRLRALGLIARMALEPAPWGDTLLAHAAATRSRFVRSAVLLARGVGATWDAASKDTLPGPNAGWRAWSHWMNGRDPRYDKIFDGRPAEPVRFEESHATAIRFYQARTGRDVVGELKAKLRAAASDSARLVFGAILTGLGETVRSPEEVAAALRTGSPAAREQATREMEALFQTAARPADAATADSLLDRLLRVAVEGAAPWPRLRGLPPAPHEMGAPQGAARRTGRLIIAGRRLPEATRARWLGRDGAEVVDSTFSLPSSEGATRLDLSGVTRVGPFARLGVSVWHLSPRVNGRGASYAAGWTYYLLRTEAGWVVVSMDSWIT